MSLDADVVACAALVEKGDPERFAAAMAGPVAARRVLFPLYALNVEVSRAPWVTQEPMIAEMRLQWWRDALDEIATGKPARRHEVVTSLAAILSAESARQLDRLVAARRWDIYKESFEDESHFKLYLTETAGTLMSVAAQTLSNQREAPASDTLHALGYATGLARFLRAVPALEAQNRVPLVDGRTAAVAGLAQAALTQCPTARSVRKNLPPAAHPAITETYLTRAILAQAARAPQRVAAGTLGVSPLRRSLLLLKWR